MSLAGFKKQISKANQYMSEKIGGAEATKLADEFVEMERQTDITNELVDEMVVKTKEYLQPNPASRAKLMAFKQLSKLGGQAKQSAYPQPEGTLGEAMVKYGKAFGEDRPFASALVDAGEALKQMADVKYALEDTVKQNFLEPLIMLQNKDLKDVMHHRKKLQGRRLDFDCKRRKQTKGGQVPEEELRFAEEKFEESLNLSQQGMHHLLESDSEQLAQLCALAEGLYEYHKQCSDILSNLTEQLNERRQDAASKPTREYVPKKLYELAIPMNDDGVPHQNSTKPSSPCCKALYDFDPENEGELGFKEGDLISLVTRIDENWYEGSVHGRKGFFPVNYVQIVVPLP